MRYYLMNYGSSQHLKTAILNYEKQGWAEPLTGKTYWSTYGQTLGTLRLAEFYVPAAASLGSYAFGGGRVAKPKPFRFTRRFNASVAKTRTTVLEGAVKSSFTRFVKKIPTNSKSSTTFEQLKDGNYLFEATSSGRVPGSKAVYQKWVTPQEEAFKMLKTTFGPDGKIIHIKRKM